MKITFNWDNILKTTIMILFVALGLSFGFGFSRQVLSVSFCIGILFDLLFDILTELKSVNGKKV